MVLAEADQWMSRVGFVDLAGSEQCESVGGGDPKRQEEAKVIQQSLFVLHRVIYALVSNHPHVPFRLSLLTQCLQSSPNGNCKTAMIANISGHVDHIRETLRTCKFADGMMKLATRTWTVTQTLSKDETIRQLRVDVQKLRDVIAQGGGPVFRGGGGDDAVGDVTVTEAMGLQGSVIDFVEDRAKDLPVVRPAAMQFCFPFMKGLIKSRSSAALKVSHLRQRLEESQGFCVNMKRQMQQRDRISKEAVYLGFYNAHDRCADAEQLRRTLRDLCGMAAALNQRASELGHERNDVEEQVDEIELTITRMQSVFDMCSGDAQREELCHTAEELRGRKAALDTQLEAARQELSGSIGLDEYKREADALREKLAAVKGEIQREFEGYWSLVSRRRPPSSPRRRRRLRAGVAGVGRS